MNDTMSRLGMSRKQFDRLAKRLEKIGILERGANNARVLSSFYSSEQIKEMIENATAAAEIPYSGLPIWKAPNNLHNKSREVREMIEEEEYEDDDSPLPVRSA